MSLPASAPAGQTGPTGLSVASFRAGVARGVALSRPALRAWLGRAAPGDYRSPFPARLRAGRAAVVALALLWLAAGFYGLGATGAIVRTVGHDTAPSVAAAQAIRTGLAAANADFALSALSGEGGDGAFLSAMRLRLRAVRGAIVEAAGNVTYGDEERGPIRTLLQGLGDYEQLVGRSTASAGDARRDLASAADDLLHWTALPAAAALERVNADHLAEDYRDYGGRHVLVWVGIAAALLVLALVAVQVDSARTARRLVNPGLLLATLAVLAATALLVARLVAAQSDLRVAKLDAFDSVYALSGARALAADADAAEGFSLLAGANTPRSAQRRQSFDALAARLLPARGDAAIRAARAGRNPGGYLGDELVNVTFDGEREAAEAAASAWDGVAAADRALRAAADRGDAAGAAASKTANGITNGITNGTSSARAAFARLDAALVAVRGINERAFATSIASAERDDAPLGGALAAGFVIAVAAAWFGIGRRLDEYRF